MLNDVAQTEAVYVESEFSNPFSIDCADECFLSETWKVALYNLLGLVLFKVEKRFIICDQRFLPLLAKNKEITEKNIFTKLKEF